MKPGDLKRLGHRIAAISYALDVLDCTCGESMSAKGGIAWSEHRRAVGLRTPTVSQSIGKRRGTVQLTTPPGGPS